MFSFETISESEKIYWYKTLRKLSRENEDLYNFLFSKDYDDDCYASACSLCDEYNDYNGSVVTVMCGASKLCFVSDVSDLVVKIPFTSTDFCAIEASNYRTGAYFNLEWYFAGTTKWENFREFFPTINFPVYFSEKMYCNIINGDYDNITYSSRNECRKQNFDTFFTTSDVDYIVRFQYGIDVYQQLVDFCVECDINDIHGDNVMYDKNGNIRFIDYSGFRDEESDGYLYSDCG